ncbi:MAG: diaminopimelate epimerase [Clostridia bacterium]|nr:diaminopimelate epimerase [Clostridia bacterium]
MRFFKMHGLGNDFVLFDGRALENTDWNALAVKVCNRHTGVGADGALILLNSAAADVRMRIFNADGSEAEMCGNGIRAFARYAFENGVVRGTEFTVETGAGVMKPRIILKNGCVDGVRVDMGEPKIESKDVPVKVDGRAIDRTLTAEDRTFPFSSVRVGVPHTMVFVDPLIESDVPKYGPLIEHDPLFPERTNVDFVQVLSSDRIKMRTWERGCGCTLACGTGACAAAVACALGGRTGRKVAVELARGTLLIEWSEADNHVYMTGPAENVFSGVWND